MLIHHAHTRNLSYFFQVGNVFCREVANQLSLMLNMEYLISKNLEKWLNKESSVYI